MPKGINVEELIKKNESVNLEFKGRAPGFKRIAKSIVAFANTEGGTLVIGVDSEIKKPVGVDDEFSVELIKEICEKLIRPEIKTKVNKIQFEDNSIILIEIPKSDSIHNVKGDKNIYVKNNDKIEIKIS